MKNKNNQNKNQQAPVNQQQANVPLAQPQANAPAATQNAKKQKWHDNRKSA